MEEKEIFNQQNNKNNIFFDLLETGYLTKAPGTFETISSRFNFLLR
jgi:hypothetical protein